MIAPGVLGIVALVAAIVALLVLVVWWAATDKRRWPDR